MLLGECVRNYAESLTGSILGLYLNKFVVSLLWSPIRKSRVKALIKPRIFMNICYEIIKNYEQLSSTISKFEAFFSKIWALFERFFAIFWALFSEFSCAIRTCLGPPILSNGKGHFGGVWLIVAGRGSRVQCRCRGSNVAVAGPRSRSRVQCRGRGSKVAVAGPMSRQGKMIWKRLIWKQYEGKKSVLCTILYGSQFTGYGMLESTI